MAIQTRMRVWKNMGVKQLMGEFSKAGFSAKRLGEAASIYKKMLDDKKCIKILTIAGALVAGGMRNVFVKAINSNLADIIVATGSTLTHDLIEAFGVKHIQGDAYANDIKLSKKNINRIYNVFLPNKGYLVLEKKLQKIFPKLPQERMSPRKFFDLLGQKIKDKNSLIKAAYKKKIPIFCPGITDSILGFQLWMYGQDHNLKVDSQLDIADFLELIWKKKRYGAVILGGGMPKHFVAGMMQVSGDSLNYAIQITMDRPEHGGVSGAPLREAKSWKKIAADALTTDVICDITIAFPLLVASLI